MDIKLLRRIGARLAVAVTTAAILALAGCSSTPPGAESTDSTDVLGGSLAHPKSRWVPVAWSDLPGFDDRAVAQGWGVMLTNCMRPNAAIAPLCDDLRNLTLASASEQRAWLAAHWQPYRIESLSGQRQGLLTSYFEPVFTAMRTRRGAFTVPLYTPPADLTERPRWFTRQQIETLPQVQAALSGHEIAWLADPIDAMMLHIQGSGRLLLTEPDGTQRTVRLRYAGTNDQPYRSITQWLRAQGVTRIAPWPDAVKVWAAQNPQRVDQLLWSNPRYVFFQEQPLSGADFSEGPTGAQGVPLTAGRSIAVDRASIPYGTPVWLVSNGALRLQKLVVAQDTGSAITGAVRADYFAGTGAEAGRLAASINQPLYLWVLWPKQ